MKLVKSLLLGSAAGLMAVTGSMAADLPSRKAAPAEYVRVCSAYGAGFFFIPGSDTCLQISGRVRAQYQWQDSYSRNDNTTGFRSMLRFGMDARTQTEYGTVRAVARLSVERRTGYATTGSGARAGTIIQANGVDTLGRLQTQVNIEAAFIQFAGITAGRAGSFFDFMSPDEWHGMAYSSQTTNLLAYTASFGGGFSATLSVEDSNERRYGSSVFNTATGASANFSQDFIGSVSALIPAGYGTLTGLNLQQRSRAADIVGNLRLEQGWGSAQLSAALVSHNFTAGLPADKWGYAIQGGVRVNLPMLAAGSNLQLNAAYGQGANAYVFGNAWTGASSNGFSGAGWGKISVSVSDNVFVSTPAGNTVAQAKAWSVAAALQHFWTPRLRSTLGVSYYAVDYPSYMNIAGTSRLRDYGVMTVMGNLIWSPVRNMDIGVEVLYSQVNLKGLPVTSANNGALTKKDDALVARMRIQRDF
ncbi:MAG: porin [Hyphomicrobiales bacterium]|nr:porin [Hyphomicrobiales bacterium]